MTTLQDSEVCWPTLHTNAQGSLTNWREKTPSRPENWRTSDPLKKITAVYCCCECSTRIQYPPRTTVNVVFTKARQRPVVSRRTFLETVVTGKLFLILNFLKGKTFVKNRELALGKNGSMLGLCSRDFLFRLVLFLGFDSSTIRTACSSLEKNHCSLHETCLQV